MVDLVQLKTGKYKGVEFLFTDMTTTLGNRLIKFNYPGSDKQSLERQGQVPSTFNMTIIVPHENYESHKNELLRVLSDGAADVLTHPTFGDIENVISGRAVLTEKISELGRAEIKVPFEVDDAPGIPQQSGDLASQVQAQSDAVNAQITEDLGEEYSVDINLSGNFSDALENLADVADAFTAASQVADPITENAADFRKAVTGFSNKIGDLITAPVDLATEIAGLFEAVNLLYLTPEDTLRGLSSIFNFGAGDPVVLPTTVALTERKRNRDLVRVNMRTQALSYAYIAAAEIEYQTTDALDLTQTDLEAQYVDVRDNQTIGNASLELLDRERVSAQATLDQVRVNTRTTITIETPLRPLSVLVYEFYGSTDLVDTIAELNNIKQNAFVSGELRILTA